LGECFAWMQRCDECIERLEECSRAKLPQLSIENRQSLVTRIARLEVQKFNCRDVLYILAVIIRTNSSDAERLIWRDIDIAFQNRIMTGAVINFKQIEPRQFLKDASKIVIERV